MLRYVEAEHCVVKVDGQLYKCFPKVVFPNSSEIGCLYSGNSLLMHRVIQLIAPAQISQEFKTADY